jgi:hypothetical protein
MNDRRTTISFSNGTLHSPNGDTSYQTHKLYTISIDQYLYNTNHLLNYMLHISMSSGLGHGSRRAINNKPKLQNCNDKFNN